MRVALEGVPETMLWTLYLRAAEAARPDSVIDDPRAVELVEAIDFPFEDRFGREVGVAGQWQALRSRVFDDAVRRFQADCPGGTVIALGDGLETTFWRTDDGRQRWLSVDLPETASVRRALLGQETRRRIWAGSALDAGWMGEVADSPGVLVIAQGLLMYLDPADVRGLFDRLAQRFPAAGFVFDTAPRWFSELARRGLLRNPATGYVAPAMPWGMDPVERWRLARRRSIDHLRELHLPAGRGVTLGLAYPLLERVPLLGDVTMRVFEARLAATGGRPRG
jgi:O-methyltransferase involved in polyketide biosynthesis